MKYKTDEDIEKIVDELEENELYRKKKKKFKWKRWWYR